MSRRNVLVPIFLTLITFGLYGLVWQWRTTAELAEESGKPAHPGLDLFLVLLTWGLWGVWVSYRNSNRAQRLLEANGVDVPDRSLPVLGFGLLTWWTGLGWLGIIALLQDQYNELAEAAPARTKRRAVRVEDEPVDYEDPIADDFDARLRESIRRKRARAVEDARGTGIEVYDASGARLSVAS